MRRTCTKYEVRNTWLTSDGIAEQSIEIAYRWTRKPKAPYYDEKGRKLINVVCIPIKEVTLELDDEFFYSNAREVES